MNERQIAITIALGGIGLLCTIFVFSLIRDKVAAERTIREKPAEPRKVNVYPTLAGSIAAVFLFMLVFAPLLFLAGQDKDVQSNALTAAKVGALFSVCIYYLIGSVFKEMGVPFWTTSEDEQSTEQTQSEDEQAAE